MLNTSFSFGNMTCFAIVIGFLCCLHFVSYPKPCEGKITTVNDTKYAVPGDDVTIEWSFTNPISDLIARIWTYERTGETLARINDRGELTIVNSSLPGIKVKPPATLILENVDLTYNGKYKFQILATTTGDTSDTSYVTVIVAVKPTVAINCSDPTIVEENDDVRCLCEGKGGKPPAKVIWYDKDGRKIGVEGDEEKVLTLNNVDGTYNGTYKCVARNYTLIAEKSIEVRVRHSFLPAVTSFTSRPEKAVLGQSVTLKCEASARPSPVYIIIYNGTEIHNSTDNTYEIEKLKFSDLGIYTCIAKNKLGISPPVYYDLTIEVKPTVTINCSSPTTVNEGSDVRCLCKGKDGNPPAKVTWYDENGGKIGVAGDEEKLLTLSNVDGTYDGTYKCVARSYSSTAEKSIEVKVRQSFVPVMTSFTSKPDPAVLGQSVTITCEARARPLPNYAIFHNCTEVHNSPENTYIINNLKYNDTGLYKCIAKNKLGTSEPKYSFVTVKEKAISNKSNGETNWYIVVVSLVTGIVIGILLSYIFGYSRRQFRNRKPRSNPSEPVTSKDNTIYQDLDLSKMNSEDNYQSLRVNSARSDAEYGNRNDSTYTDLNKVRDVENNYQSLT